MRSTGYLTRHFTCHTTTIYMVYSIFMAGRQFRYYGAYLPVCHFPTNDEGLYYFSICVDHKIALWFGAGQREIEREERGAHVLHTAVRIKKAYQMQHMLCRSLSNAPWGLRSGLGHNCSTRTDKIFSLNA